MLCLLLLLLLLLLRHGNGATGAAHNHSEDASVWFSWLNARTGAVAAARSPNATGRGPSPFFHGGEFVDDYYVRRLTGTCAQRPGTQKCALSCDLADARPRGAAGAGDAVLEGEGAASDRGALYQVCRPPPLPESAKFRVLGAADLARARDALAGFAVVVVSELMVPGTAAGRALERLLCASLGYFAARRGACPRLQPWVDGVGVLAWPLLCPCVARARAHALARAHPSQRQEGGDPGKIGTISARPGSPKTSPGGWRPKQNRDNTYSPGLPQDNARRVGTQMKYGQYLLARTAPRQGQRVETQAK